MCRDHEIPARDDERGNVDVVHPDPRLGEHRPVDEHREADERREDRRSEEPPREEHKEERQDRGEEDTGEPPGERVTTGLDEIGTRGAGDDELVAFSVDPKKRSRDGNRRVGGRPVGLDHHDAAFVERVKEIGARYDGERGGGGRERAGAPVRE